ncbi:MAG: 16S rRNA (uracil(1498)-N(3))-methyltransferase [Bacteroidota bacterium]|nr:16S rRNA (uracil(1498)-N(3))-methyltransferase [Bacteroidota bacterium]MDX5505343.1 16S rRNA (uracil(1498)-N(3))-methyltransferase [Bacteroidota bacterium]
MRLFFGERISENEASLSADESHHAVRVLRLGEGEQIGILTREGALLSGPVIRANKRECTIRIEKETLDYGSVPYRLHMAVAPTKNIDRFEWFLEKATEIGVSRVTPLLTDRSERRSIKTDRLNKVIASAVKQSHKGQVPILDDLTPLPEFISSQGSKKLFIAHCEPGEKAELSQVLSNLHEAVIMIGPEGDFSPEEIDLALGSGATPVNLGDFRLRTETAALVAVHTASLFLKRDLS